MKNVATLADRRNDLTRKLILDAAIEMLEHGTVGELTVRAAAKQANMSERTVFRHFPSREDFLDAVAEEMRTRLELPPPPTSLAELQALPRSLYQAFEANASLTKAALHSELYQRMRDTAAKARWSAVSNVIDEIAPKRSEQEKKIAIANIRYFLTATAWHYYRFNFGLSLEESIECAETAILQAVGWIRKPK